MHSRYFTCWLAVLISLVAAVHAAYPDPFTCGAADAQKFGTHEIELTGNGSVSNPFATEATVTFTAPSGRKVTVDAFNDGGNSWKARA